MLAGDTKIPLGSFVKVLAPGEDHQQIVIPRTFIRYQYGQAYVWIWNKFSQQAEQITLELGDCDTQHCEVQEGLSEKALLIRL